MATTPIEPFGTLLRRLRLAAALGQAELAERSGLSVRGIRALESGERASPRPPTVRMLADALGLDGAARQAFIAAAHPSTAEPSRSVTSSRTMPRAPLSVRARLPQPPTRLIGREREIAEACRLLRQPDVRWVSLTGPGGIGKTRVAVAVARDLAGDFGDGVAFVDLSSVRDPALVPATIARALDVREQREQPMLETLHAFIADRSLLLVLDNCEQVLPGLPAAAYLLAIGRDAKVLATSRERPHLRGEREIPIAPLAVPDPVVTVEHQPDQPDQPDRPNLLATLAAVPAVRLFVDLATDSIPAFRLTPGNAAAVADICRSLDGVPLAIELAAARLRHLSPETLAARLTGYPIRSVPGRMRELTDGARDLPDRQRTMRAAISWSHDLLSDAEQTLFRRLAVFEGGFGVDAAGVVCGPTGVPVPSVVDLLALLVDRSLLHRVNGTAADARFGMLETIREFASERLEESGEAATVRGRHAAWCLALAERVDEDLFGADYGWRLDLLVRERANCRAALAWLETHADPAETLRLALALGRLGLTHGQMAEGRCNLERALARADGAPPALRAAALHSLGALAVLQGDYAVGSDWLEASLRILHAESDPTNVARAVAMLGAAAEYRGDDREAVARYEEALCHFRTIGDGAWIANLLDNLADAAYRLGDHDRAVEMATESLEHARALRDVWGELNGLVSLAQAECALGRVDRAATLLLNGAKLGWAEAPRLAIADLIGGFAALALVSTGPTGRGDVERRAADAARLLGAADAWRVALGHALLPHHAQARRTTEAARVVLGEPAFAAAWAAGAALTPDDALALAEAVAHARTDAARSERPPVRGGAVPPR